MREQETGNKMTIRTSDPLTSYKEYISSSLSTAINDHTSRS
jgi:hypothetical protein